MKKSILKMICALLCISILFGCSSGANATTNGKNSKEITKALDAYFDAYANADAKALDAIACPEGTSIESVEKAIEQNKSDKYEGLNHYLFYKETSIFCFQVALASTDFSHCAISNEEYIGFLKAKEEDKVRFEYEITNILSDHDCKTISYKDGLKTIDADASTYVANFISPDVKEWYVVKANVKWYMNDVLYGWDKTEVQRFSKQYELSWDPDSTYSQALENMNTGYTFIVYNLNGNWYVYHPEFTRTKAGHHLDVVF